VLAYIMLFDNAVTDREPPDFFQTAARYLACWVRSALDPISNVAGAVAAKDRE
jgi:hypothetical protein